MPGPAPNVTRDNFSADKLYQTVVHEQGVPIFDESLNTPRMAELWHRYQTLLHTVGDGRLPGWKLGPEESIANNVNNFRFVRGNIVDSKGRIVILNSANSGGRYEYTDQGGATYDNSMGRGKVSAFDNVAKTISNSSYLVRAEFVLANCRIKMLTGANAGTIYTIQSANGAVFTLSGAPDLSALVIGNSYIILPPVLTTPVGGRTDDVVLLSWVDYLDETEDTDIPDPTTAMSAYQAAKLHWCVRVDEGQVGIFNQESDWLKGVSVAYIGSITRTANVATITSLTSAHASAKDIGATLKDVTSPQSAIFPNLYSSLSERLNAMEMSAVFQGQFDIANGSIYEDKGKFTYEILDTAYVRRLRLFIRAYVLEEKFRRYLPAHDHNGFTDSDDVGHSHTLDSGGGGQATLTDPGGHTHTADGTLSAASNGGGTFNVQQAGLQVGADAVVTVGGEIQNQGNTVYKDEAVAENWDVTVPAHTHDVTGNTSSAGAHTHTLGGSTEAVSLLHAHPIAAEGSGTYDPVYLETFVKNLSVALDGFGNKAAEIIAQLVAQFPAMTQLGDGTANVTDDNAIFNGVEVNLLTLNSAGQFKATGKHTLEFANANGFGGRLEVFVRVN